MDNSNIYESSIIEFFNTIKLSMLSVPDIRISDILDILIVAVLIYILTNWIRETRAWALLKGTIFIILISVVSFKFNLYTTYWIIERTLSVGIIAFLILFQPEFRKGLEQIGKSRITKHIFNSTAEEKIPRKILEEIMTACFKMSKVKTGALIVVEQSVPIGDFEESGISIDAVVSSQLLLNIFEDKTPLHDGAVTIRNNRISKATCILPLTNNKIESDFGTRHRAAIGGSEVCDAYIFVVSEETGYVSIAHNGKIRKNLSKEDIEKMFETAEQPSTKKINIWKGKKS